MRILIVDDQSFNLDALEAILTYKCMIDCKRIVDRALSGKEAIEKVKQNLILNKFNACDYFLILMDCNMPFIDGYQSTDIIRSMIHEHKLP